MNTMIDLNNPDHWLRLNLVFPPSLEDALTEALLSDPAVPGFTLLRAEGHGNDFTRASIGEQVRGRIDRRVLWMVIPQSQLEPLLQNLKQHITSTEIRWWAEPIIANGKLA